MSNTRIQVLRVGSLTFEGYEAQRSELPSRARLKEFVPWKEDSVGVGKVNRVDMPDGTFQWRVLDGRTRATAAKEQFGPDYLMRFEVFDNLSDKEASEIFIVSNATKNISPYDMYRNGVIAGTHPYPLIKKVLDEVGLAAAKSASKNRVGAINAMLRIESDYGIETLRTTFAVVIESFGYDKVNWDNGFLQAIALLIYTNPDIDLKHLVKTLKRVEVDVWLRRGRSRVIGGGGSSSRSNPIALEIALLYNNQKKVAPVFVGRGGLIP